MKLQKENPIAHLPIDYWLFKQLQFILRPSLIQPFKIFKEFLISGDLVHWVHDPMHIIHKFYFIKLIVDKIHIYHIAGGPVHAYICAVFILRIVNTFGLLPPHPYIIDLPVFKIPVDRSS